MKTGAKPRPALHVAPPPEEKPLPLAVRPERAAELLSVKRDTIYELIRKGIIPSKRVGRVRLISVDALRKFLQ